ncbi:MFS transporter [Isoptericola sediminis]|uniref:MFS transporter n=1 Tax=Isoptericola sediminis TaxID=2733572 RepID=A0A849K9Z8_9MICO|nr:MFS transporter [Isoptericola sediminis]NNU28595.1 MFS transporter [Isoptericola sediminis]
MDAGGQAARSASSGTARRAPTGRVLATLILVAAVANLNLSVANVALPDIGDALDASQVQLNLVAVGYSLGLSASVLYLGAVGDRYGRKLLLLIGTGLTVPFSLLAAWAPSVEVLFVARLGGGLCAGMAFPTTLALISALWSGPGRTRAIALWSGIGAAFAALGPLAAGWSLTQFWWGSVFLLTVPLAAIAFVMAIVLVPSHVNESVEPVDHLGGVLSVLLVGSLVMGINLLAVPGRAGLLAVLGGTVVGAGTWFVLRQLRAENPLYDLRVAARPTFWVAAVAGLIIFGSLMGAMYIGQLFMQNVLGYSSVAAGAAILPGAVGMVLVAPRSAALVERHGSRATMLSGYVFVLLGFLVMLLLWREGIGYWAVGLAYLLVGVGVGLSGTPASNSLTGSVPVQRVGMASGTADLQRDLGGAIMQSAFGALLAAGYASSMATAISGDSDLSDLTASTQATLEKSFAGAESIASQYPQYSDEIVAAARESFLAGDQWAYLAGIVAVLLGSLLVLLAFPRRDRERELRARYQPPSET